MKNPWTEIKIDDYENHMSSDNVYQLQTMNSIMKKQFSDYQINSVMILGVAGGNGLEHINSTKIKTVYGIDINQSYLNTCKMRYPSLKNILKTLCIDLTDKAEKLPSADLLVANLLIEYIGYECFESVVNQVKPKYISCVIQVNTDTSFVSHSPYIHAFDNLDSVLHSTTEDKLVESMQKINYNKIFHSEYNLPNGKKLVQIDFKKQ